MNLERMRRVNAQTLGGVTTEDDDWTNLAGFHKRWLEAQAEVARHLAVHQKACAELPAEVVP